MVALTVAGATKWSGSIVGAAANDDRPPERETVVLVTGFPVPRLWTDRAEAVRFLLDRAVACLREGVVPPAVAATRLTDEELRTFRAGLSFEDLDRIINGRGCTPGLWLEIPWQWVRGRDTVVLPPAIATLGDADLRRLLLPLVHAAI